MKIRRERTFVRRRRIALGTAAATRSRWRLPRRRGRWRRRADGRFAPPRGGRPGADPGPDGPRGGTRTASPTGPPTTAPARPASDTTTMVRRERITGDISPKSVVASATRPRRRPEHDVPPHHHGRTRPDGAAGRDDPRRGRPRRGSGSRATRARRAARRSRRRSPPTARTPTSPTTRCTARASGPRGSTPARPSDGTRPSFVYRVDTAHARGSTRSSRSARCPSTSRSPPTTGTVLVTNWCTWDLSVIDVAHPPGRRAPCRSGRYPRGIAVVARQRHGVRRA